MGRNGIERQTDHPSDGAERRAELAPAAGREREIRLHLAEHDGESRLVRIEKEVDPSLRETPIMKHWEWLLRSTL